MSPLCLLQLLLLCMAAPAAVLGLQVGFYDTTCPLAESIVQATVLNHFTADSSVPAALLRLYFHDCFVTGCDASILIDPTTANPQVEKNAGPNLTVRGYDLIADAKASVEAQCPSTVSCADIIALATRDAVALAGGLNYPVPTGRLDGLISDPANTASLPSPQSSVSQSAQVFATRGLTVADMVVLLGGHTVGIAHCSFFQERLSGAADPNMDPTLRAGLVNLCQGNGDPSTFLDQSTPFAVDNSYYNELMAGRGIMQIDQALTSDSTTAGFVSTLGSDTTVFQQSFADALVKLGSLAVAGSAGEIRNFCNAFN